jgi:hypothetical protein
LQGVRTFRALTRAAIWKGTRYIVEVNENFDDDGGIVLFIGGNTPNPGPR